VFRVENRLRNSVWVAIEKRIFSALIAENGLSDEITATPMISQQLTAVHYISAVQAFECISYCTNNPLHDMNREPLVLRVLYQSLNRRAQRIQHDPEMIALTARLPEALMTEWKRKALVGVACCLEHGKLLAFGLLRCSQSEKFDRTSKASQVDDLEPYPSLRTTSYLSPLSSDKLSQGSIHHPQ